jgi:integrase
MLTTGLRAHEVLGLRVEDVQRVGAHAVAIVTGKGGARACEAAAVSSDGAPGLPPTRRYCERANLSTGSLPPWSFDGPRGGRVQPGRRAQLRRPHACAAGALRTGRAREAPDCA